MRTLCLFLAASLLVPALLSGRLVGQCVGGRCIAGGGQVAPVAAPGVPLQAGPTGACPLGDPCVPNPYDWNTALPAAARIFPSGGYTAYPPRGVDCRNDFSPYRQVYWLVAPPVTAQVTQSRLQNLGIPLVTPDPEYLGKNPQAEKAPLPRPRAPEGKPEKEEKNPEEKEKKPEEKKPEDKLGDEKRTDARADDLPPMRPEPSAGPQKLLAPPRELPDPAPKSLPR